WAVDRFGPHGGSSLDVAVRADGRDAIPCAADLHLGATRNGYLRSRNLTPDHRDRRLGRLAPASRLQAFPLVHHVDPDGGMTLSAVGIGRVVHVVQGSEG